MSSQEEHEARCLEVLGKPWSEVHEWLDHYFDEVPGASHRIVLHHRLGIAKGVEKFGEEARPALELHLQDDFEFIPETPEEVAQIMRGQDLLSFYQMDLLGPILARLWPGVMIDLRGRGEI